MSKFPMSTSSYYNESYFQYDEINNANMFPCKENIWVIFAKRTRALPYKESNAPKHTQKFNNINCAFFIPNIYFFNPTQFCVGYILII